MEGRREKCRKSSSEVSNIHLSFVYGATLIESKPQ